MSTAILADQGQASFVSWPLLLRQLWVTAVGWAAAIALVASVDIYTRAKRLAESKAHPKVYSAKRASRDSSGKGSDLHQQLYRTFHPSRSGLGVAIELVAVVLGFCQWILYLYSTYREEWNTAVSVLNIVFTSFFIIRLTIRVSVVESGRRVPWMLHMDRGCDVWASVSSLITFAPYSHTFWNFTFLRIVNVYFAAVDLENWYEPVFVDRLWRFVMKMILLVTAFLAVMAAVVSTLERAGNPPGWDVIVSPRGAFTSFNSLYWALITTTTVGYGDIAPTTVFGRLATMVFMVGGIVIVGFFTTRLLELLAGEKLGRGSLFNPSRKSTVLIVGEIQDETLKNVLHELYHPEHPGARASLATVVMVEQHLRSAEMTQYLRAHTLFSNTVTYIVGSVFEGADLMRAGADRPECQAVLCMQQVHGEDDTANLLRVLAIRRRFPSLPIYAMLANSDNIPFLRAAGVWEDGILPMDTIKQGLMAANVVTPGVATLLINMFSVDVGVQALAVDQRRRRGSRLLARGPSKHQLPHTGPPAVEWAQRDRAQTVPARAPEIEYDLSTATRRFAVKLMEVLTVRSLQRPGPLSQPAHWQQEYGAGLGQEVFEVKCPSWLVGKQLLDAVVIIFCSKLIREATELSHQTAQSVGDGGSAHARAALQPGIASLGQLADAVLNGLHEGPVLVAVSHVSRDTGELHFWSDLRSHRALAADDSLFILARHLNELGQDMVAAGKRIIEAHPTLVSAVITGTPTRTESAAGSPSERSDELGAFQRTLTQVGAVTPRGGTSAEAPTQLLVDFPGSFSPERSVMKRPHAMTEAFIRPDPRPSDSAGVTNHRQTAGEEPPEARINRPARRLTTTSTPAGVVYSGVDMDRIAPGRAEAAAESMRFHAASNELHSRSADSRDTGDEFTPPADLTGHIVIMTTGGISGLTGLPHLLFPLRFLTSRPVVVVTGVDRQQWDSFVQQLKGRLCYESATTEAAQRSTRTNPELRSNQSRQGIASSLGGQVRREHAPPFIRAPLYYVHGSPLQGSAMVQARLVHARRCVILTSVAHTSDRAGLEAEVSSGTLGETVTPTHPLDFIMTDAAAILSTLIIENSLVDVAPALLYGTCTEVTRDGSIGLLTPAWRLSTTNMVPSGVHEPWKKSELEHDARAQGGQPGHESTAESGTPVRPPTKTAEQGAIAATGTDVLPGSSEEDRRDIELLLQGQTDRPALPRGRSAADLRLQSVQRSDASKQSDEPRSSTPSARVTDMLRSAIGATSRGATKPTTPLAQRTPSAQAHASTSPARPRAESTLIADENIHRQYQQAWEDAQDRRDLPSEHTTLDQQLVDPSRASWVELDPSAGMGIGFRWSPRFAAGRIMPSSAVFSLLVQAFYNPSLLRLIRLFARGDTVQIRHVPVPLAILHRDTCHTVYTGDVRDVNVDSQYIRRSGTMDSQPGRMPPEPIRAPGSQGQTRHDNSMPGGKSCKCTIPYARLFLHMVLKEKVIPLGLFRDKNWAASPLPYVHANPNMCSPVRAGDVMFVVVPRQDN